MKNKKGIIIISIIGAVLIIAGILLVFLLPKKSSKQLYADALGKSLGLISNEDEGLNAAIEKIQEKIEKNNYKLTIKAETRADEAGYETSESVLYVGKDKAYFTENSVSNDLSYALEAMLKNDNLYFGMKGVLDNVYYINEFGKLLKESDEDSFTDKIADYMADAFVDALENKEVKTDSYNLEVNGNKYKTTRYTYTFTGNTLYAFAVNFLENIKSDKEIYKDINKLLKSTGALGPNGDVELSRDDINTMLDQFIESAESLKKIGEIGTYTVYMYDDEAIGTEIVITAIGEPISINDYHVKNGDKEYEKLAILEKNTVIFEIVLDGKAKNNIEITMSTKDGKVVDGYIKESNGDYELKLSGVGDKADNYILFKANSDNTGKLEIVSDIKKISATYKIEKVDEIPEMDITGSKPYEEMSYKDKYILESILGMIFPGQGNTIDYGFEGLDM